MIVGTGARAGPSNSPPTTLPVFIYVSVRLSLSSDSSRLRTSAGISGEVDR